MSSKFKSKHESPTGRIGRRLRLERLEERRVLAIVWANEFDAPGSQFDPAFEAVYQDNAPLARALVNRAINDWEQVIESFNYADDNDADPLNDLNDTFELTVMADSGPFGFTKDFTEAGDEKPQSATIAMGQDAGSFDWFFDATPDDDAEFTSLMNDRAASFIDTRPQSGEYDFFASYCMNLAMLWDSPRRSFADLPRCPVTADGTLRSNSIGSSSAALAKCWRSSTPTELISTLPLIPII